MFRRFMFYEKNGNYVGTVEMSLKYKDGQACFFVMGLTPWSSGQIIRELGIKIECRCEQSAIDLRKEIKGLWSQYHLNDLHAGTEKQEKYLKMNRLDNLSYDKTCEILDIAGLLVDDGYKYGSGRLTYQIPLNDLKRIENLFIRKPPRFVVANTLSINSY